MTTASQTPGALPPETPAAVPGGTTYADPWEGSDVPHRLRSPYPEPMTEGPACTVCAAPAGVEDTALYPDPAGRRYPSGAQVLYCRPCLPPGRLVRAAETVIAAAMERGEVTPRALAQAEADSGILFDAKVAQDIAGAAAEQAHAEDQADIEGCRAELADARRELAAMAGAQRKVDAVARLLEGRPGTYLLPVAEVAAAAEYGTTPLDAFPMPLTWRPEDGVDIPGPGDTGRRAIVRCRSAHGQMAHLVVEGDDRTKLASLVGSEFRDTRVPCPEQWCGHEQDWDPADPALFGWSRLQIASTGDVPRWYCSDMCVIDALTRAGHDLAAADQAAAVDPDQQAPALPDGELVDHRYGDPLAHGPSGIPCGCGKPAHSNLVPCQQDEYDTEPEAAGSVVSGE